MRRVLLVLPLLLLFSACSNDQFSAVGTPAPIAQAPSYPGGWPVTGGPGFVPQLPQGYSNYFYMYTPLVYYFTAQPQMMPYWNQIWSTWGQYANNYGVSPYNFSYFWYNFAPNYMAPQLYSYFNSSFYNWMTPQTQVPQYADPSSFWYYYSGMSYGSSGCCECGMCY